MGAFQGYCPCCRTHSRDYQQCSGCQVQISNGSNRLEAASRAICPDQQGMGPTGGRPIRDLSVQSTLKVLQLETRPTGGGNRCLQPGVESPKGVCKSPMVPGRQRPQPCKESTNLSYSRGSSLEGTALVPSSARDAARLSQATTVHRLIQWKADRSQWDLLPQLAVWPISRKSLDVQAFQVKLRAPPLITEKQKILLI